MSRWLTALGQAAVVRVAAGGWFWCLRMVAPRVAAGLLATIALRIVR